jgi:AraC-like DNA-binding protein
MLNSLVLDASSDARLGSSRVRAIVGIERDFLLYVAHRERLRYDTKYLPRPVRARGIATISLYTRGVVEVDGRDGALGVPRGYVLAENELERPDPGAPSIQLSGAASTGLELRVPTSVVLAPIGATHGPLTLSSSTWDAVHDLAALAENATPAMHGDPRVATTTRALLEGLARDRILSFGLAERMRDDEPPELTRIMDALRPSFASFQVSPSLSDLKRRTGLSIAYLSRDLVRFVTTFGLFGHGFRDFARILRIRTAVVWLSSPDVTATLVADVVGYSNLEAMNRAFKSAGLPSPGVVRAAVQIR